MKPIQKDMYPFSYKADLSIKNITQMHLSSQDIELLELEKSSLVAALKSSTHFNAAQLRRLFEINSILALNISDKPGSIAPRKNPTYSKHSTK